MDGLNLNNNTSIMAMNVPLDNFASSPLDQGQASPILALCVVEDISRGSSCYVYSTCKLSPERKWRAGTNEEPDGTVTDSAIMLTGLGVSHGCEEGHQKAGISKGVASFIKEMKQSSVSVSTSTATTARTRTKTRTGTTTAATPTGTAHSNHLADQPCRKMNSEDLDEVQVKKMMTEEQIELTLTITSNDCNMNTWRGFVSEGSLFLKGDGWDDLSIRESVVAALDLAEEQLECHTVFLCLEKNNSNLDALVRTLMYAGFEIVLPGVLPNADPKYLALGMEL